MSHALLRILMAMYLAIWSPAVCCCGIKGALGHLTGISIAECAEAPPTDIADRGAEQGWCCAKKAASAAIQTSLLAVDRSAGEQSPCRCHESVESKSRLDTGAKITLPQVGQAEFSASAPVLPVVTMTVSPIITRPGVGFNLPPPLRSTLLAQCCLLLI